MFSQMYVILFTGGGVPGSGGSGPGDVLGGAWSPWGLVQGSLVPVGVPGGDTPDGYCCGRYASYWNAFTLWNKLYWFSGWDK